MKASFLMIQIFLCVFFLCVSLCAENAETLVPETDWSASIEERRAEATGKRLERFETMAGRVYQDVRITKINQAGISFVHSSGAARLRFEDLSPEQRRYFGIDGEDAAEVYAREARARIAYEKSVEENEKARRELAEKAAARAEAERRAMEKAAERREIAAFAESAGTIPAYPTVKRVDSTRRYSSRYRYHSYYPGFRYAYPVRYGYRPYFRHRGACGPFHRAGIHFTVK